MSVTGQFKTKRIFPILLLVLLFVAVLAILSVQSTSAHPWEVQSEATLPDHDGQYSPLRASYKAASTFMVAPDEVFTYTIYLINTGEATLSADVQDVLPQEVGYVDGTVSGGGSYDSATRKITWEGVSVPPGAVLPLTFSAQPAVTVNRPKAVVNTARISADNKAFERTAMVTLMPAHDTSGSDLDASRKTASKSILAAGETFTYTIQLQNSGVETATANVTDPLPASIDYVAGSADNGGVYDDVEGKLTWSNIEVAPKSSVSLKFMATIPSSISESEEIVNTATIASGSDSIQRSARVFVAEAPSSPLPILAGSYKKASQFKLAPGDELTYTIRVHNSGRFSSLVDVSDPIPAELSYVPGSASDGGVYDEATATLSWTDVTASHGRGNGLTFRVTPAITVTESTVITNVATITSDAGSVDKKVQILLIPESEVGDEEAPEVASVVIGEGDVLTDLATTLHISATDNVGVQWMFIREFVLTTSPKPHWKVDYSSGWVPFQADYPWTLIEKGGTHYVTVWVADGSGNVSHADNMATDFASLILPDDELSCFGMRAYMVYYESGISVSATVTSTTGDVSLYQWQPGNRLLPDHKRHHMPLTGSDTISFTTSEAGIYLFLVFGEADAQFNLSISPAGGLRVPESAQHEHEHFAAIQAATTSTYSSDGLTSEPVISQSGEDPLAVATAPSAPYILYLPDINSENY